MPSLRWWSSMGEWEDKSSGDQRWGGRVLLKIWHRCHKVTAKSLQKNSSTCSECFLRPAWPTTHKTQKAVELRRFVCDDINVVSIPRITSVRSCKYSQPCSSSMAPFTIWFTSRCRLIFVSTGNSDSRKRYTSGPSYEDIQSLRSFTMTPVAYGNTDRDITITIWEYTNSIASSGTSLPLITSLKVLAVDWTNTGLPSLISFVESLKRHRMVQLSYRRWLCSPGTHASCMCIMN